MTKLTENVFAQHPIASNMIICRHKDGNDSMSVDVRADNVIIEIDNDEDRCVSFDMSMDDAKAFFAAAHDVIVPAKSSDVR